MEIKVYSKKQIYFPGVCFWELRQAELRQTLLVNDEAFLQLNFLSKTHH